MRPTTITGLAAALLALPVAPAVAQPAGYEGLAGVWHQDDWQSIEIGPETVTLSNPESRWVVDPTTCPVHFEHAFEMRSGDDIAAFFGLDTDDPQRAGDALLAALPQGETPIATLWSYCAAEAHGGVLYFLTGADELTGLYSAEGDTGVVRYYRLVPAPSHDALHPYDRRRIQEALQRRGLYTGPIDGLFGPATERAIRAYQRSIDAEPTGILTRHQTIEMFRDG